MFLVRKEIFQKTMTVMFSLFITVTFFSCAKDKAYEPTLKDRDAKDMNLVFDLEQDPDGKGKITRNKFLYVPSTLGAPMNVQAMFSFLKGSPKIVKLRFAEAGIEVIEMEDDPRFANNPLNNTPVLTVPVDYSAYRCKLDEEDRCLNEEEVITDPTTEWYQKPFFVAKYDQLKENEINRLHLSDFDNCFQETGIKLISREINKKVFNIEVEKTFKVTKSPKCILPLLKAKTLSSAGFKMRFFYSLVDLDSLESENYKPLIYPEQDHDTYGFFKSTKRILDNVYDPSRENIVHYLDRWNPKKKKIVYYLNDSFDRQEVSIEGITDDPEKMKQLIIQRDQKLLIKKLMRKATFKSFEKINNGLKRAKVPFKLVLKRGTSSSRVGDLRFNSINLINDPKKSSVLGYGPHISSPRTGEIVHAHINMYGGAYLRGIRWAYEGMADLSEDRAKKALVNNAKFFNADTEKYLASLSSEITPSNYTAPSSTNEIYGEITKKFEAAEDNSFMSSSLSKEKIEAIYKREISKKLVDYDDTKNLDGKSFLEDGERLRLVHLGKQAVDTIDLLNIAQFSKREFPGIREIEDILTTSRTLKRWIALTKKQQNKVIKVMLPIMYVQTFVHEMGHNLGLRHNFQGSFDKKNFYTPKELEDYGIEGTPAYSSIMDYGASELNELADFGSYDIAALRFAYNREVEIFKTKKFVKVKGPLYKFLEKGIYRSYMYCTDENASLSGACNRHDEGSDLVEVAEIVSENYWDQYKYRNYRNFRHEFSTYGISGSVSSRVHMFKRARTIFEDFENLIQYFGIKSMSEGCTPEEVAQYPGNCVMINEKRDAIMVIGKMFLDIIKEPDLTCAFHPEGLPELVETAKLRDVYLNNMSLKFNLKYVPKTCFDPAIKKFFKKLEGCNLTLLNRVAEKKDLEKFPAVTLLKEKEKLISYELIDGEINESKLDLSLLKLLEPGELNALKAAKFNNELSNHPKPFCGAIKKLGGHEFTLVGQKIKGQAGRYLNHIKDPNRRYKYTSDIAVRGVWHDKVLAMKYLTERYLGLLSTERRQNSMIDVAAIRNELLDILSHILLKTALKNPTKFLTETGEKFDAEYMIDDTYKILEQPKKDVKEIFGLPKKGSVSLNEILIKTAYESNFSEDSTFELMSETFRRLLKVHKRSAVYGRFNNDDLAQIEHDNNYYIANKDNIFANIMLERSMNYNALNVIDKEAVKKVFGIRFQGKFELPADFTVDEVALGKLGLELLETLLKMQEQQSNPKPTLVMFVARFGPINGPIFWKGYQMKTERLKELKEAVIEATQVPEDAPDEVKFLYALKGQILADFINGVLEHNVKSLLGGVTDSMFGTTKVRGTLDYLIKKVHD